MVGCCCRRVALTLMLWCCILVKGRADGGDFCDEDNCFGVAACYIVENCENGVFANKGDFKDCAQAMPYCDPCFQSCEELGDGSSPDKATAAPTQENKTTTHHLPVGNSSSTQAGENETAYPTALPTTNVEFEGCSSDLYSNCLVASTCYIVENCENGVFANKGDFKNCAQAMPHCDPCFQSCEELGSGSSPDKATAAPTQENKTNLPPGCQPEMVLHCSGAAGCYVSDNCKDGKLQNAGPYSACANAMPYCDPCFENPCPTNDASNAITYPECDECAKISGW